MSDVDPPISPVRTSKVAECPECGEAFAPRGLAPHRRMRHGIAPEVAVELAGTLSRIASVLERLDARMSNGGTRDSTEELAPPPPLPENSAPPRAKHLEEGLRQVLAEIARVKKETERQISALGEQTRTDEQRLLEETAFHALGSLRRRQADLIYRLHAEGQSNCDGIDVLTSL